MTTPSFSRTNRPMPLTMRCSFDPSLAQNKGPMAPRGAPRFQVTVLAGLLAAATAPVWAQSSGAAASPAWSSLANAAPPGQPRALSSGPYAGNAQVRRVAVEVDRNALPADGQSATRVVVQLFDANGALLKNNALLTVETSAGRLQLPGAKTDELGPGRLDADPATPGTQILVKGGRAEFNLLAPDTPQDVLLRVTAGAAQAEGLVSFVADARQLIAVGLVEGVVRLSRKDSAQLQQVRLEDGFEAELRRFSRSFSDGKGQAAARAAVYLKGKILGQALITAAFDSDKPTRFRLLRDIKPDEFYPVYGDSSSKTFDAQSSSRLYVRVDHNRSYALYGDFNTADGFGAAYGAPGTAPVALQSLGAYSRSLTGARASWQLGEAGQLRVGGFAAHDTLKQVSEEFRATGTSGPFVLRNNSALENSEKIELLVRSKDNPGVIKTQRVLLRLDDYSFEPFSGRILLNRPVSGVDADGDLVSLRVTYEVDQGGDRFWVGGLEASAQFGDAVRVGAAAVSDRNPVSPYTLGSVHLGARLAEKTWLSAEVARSESTRYLAGGAYYSNPTQIGGEQRQNRSGNAARIGIQHQGQSTTLELNVARTQAGFDNPQAPLQAGRSEANVKGSVQVLDSVTVFAEGLLSQDRSTGGERKGAALGAEVKLSDQLQLHGGLRKAQENGSWRGNNAGFASLGVTLNPAPGSTLAPSGGLWSGIDPVVVNPSNGQSIITLAATGAPTLGQGIQVNATTLFLGARWQASERLAVEGLVEGDISGDNKHRVVLAGAYSVGERSRLVARYEGQSGITSAYGAARSSVFSLGADTSYMPGGQLFSEYRLRDAVGRDAQWANGVRNTWALREGVTYTTAVEWLKVLDGQGGNAAALALGYDNTASELWKLGSKLEARRVFDNRRTPFNDRSDSLLSTVQVARKLNRDWTGLVRNYLLLNRQAQPNGGATVNAVQDRLQLGVAYRPVDNNRLDLLSKFESKFSRNAEQQFGLTERVHLGSVQAIYHPTRPYWLSGRLAAKARSETGLSTLGKTQYNAVMLSGRVVYDLSENIDLGFMAASLMGNPGRSRQSALGVEAGYLVQQNLWLSAGYNWRGFADRDLAGSDYTNSGVFLRLRFKFDEDLFASTSRAINRALDR
jgi:hypothetical protein